MKTKTVLTALLILSSISACAGDPDLGGATTLPEEAKGMAEELRNEMEEIGSQIETSEAADELRQEWTEVRAEIEAAIDATSNGTEFDATPLEEAMDEFQTDLEVAGDQLDDEVKAAWNALRAQIEQLIS